MNPLFLIPARGGSKGIPGKNIKQLGDKPLIAYSIDVARELTDDANICVSTDDPIIASVVTADCELPIAFMRPAELATDSSGSREVMLHAIEYYKELGRDYDTIVLLQPTSPFRTADDIKEAIKLYKEGVDMVVSVTESSTNPYYNCYEIDNDGNLAISKGDGKYTRRQDAPKTWEFNGAVYIINVESLKKYPLGEMPKRVMYEMPSDRSLDLDTPIDWMVAESIIKK